MQAAQVALGAVFAASAWAKVRRPSAFVEAVRGYPVLPSAFASVTAWLVIAAEGMLAVSLLTGLGAEAAVVLAVALFAVFLALVTITLRRGADVACGCFGASDQRITIATAGRLVGLLVAGTFVAVAWQVPHLDPLTIPMAFARGVDGIEQLTTTLALAAAATVVAFWAASASAMGGLWKAQRFDTSRVREAPGAPS